MTGEHNNGWDHRVERMRRRLELLERVQVVPDGDREALIQAIDDPALKAEIVTAMKEQGEGLPVLVSFDDPPKPPPIATATGSSDGDDDDQRMPSPLGKGDRIGRYAMLDDGQGGLASVVHRAEDEATGNTVAFKLLRPMATSLDRHQFEKQRLILEAIDHPQIPTAIDHGQVASGPARGLPFVVMPWIEGEQFRVWAKKKSWREVVRLLADVLDIAGAAHSAKVVHRDLTPSNILVRDERKAGGQLRAWVVDFGISRLTGGPLSGMTPATSNTRGGAGTTWYMAPEQFVGGGRIGPTTDLYAAGCVLYEALTGTKPHAADPKHDTAFDIARRRAQGPPQMPAGMDAQIASILRLVLAANPDERGYANAAELATDLRRAADGLPILKRPPGPARRASLWVRRNPALAMLTAVLTIVLVGAYIAGAIQAGRIADARDEAQLAQAAAERRFESLRGFTSFVLESHDGALRRYPELIEARRELTEQAALAMAAIDAHGPATLEQALHQAKLWLLLSEIGLNIYGRSLWSAEQAHEAAARAIELMEPWKDSGDPRVQSVRARALLRANRDRLVPRLERVARNESVADKLERVYRQSPDLPEAVIAYAEAVMRVGLGHAWHENGHVRATEALRKAVELAEEAMALAPHSQRVLGTRAFILNQLGGQLRQGDAADRQEALGVLMLAVSAYDAMAILEDSYLDAQGAGARSNLAGLLMNRGDTVVGLLHYADAIARADTVQQRDPAFDRARRAAVLARYWAAHDLLQLLSAPHRAPFVGRPILDAMLADLACHLADDTLRLQLQREDHLRATGDERTLRDEAHYLATAWAQRQRAYAMRTLLRGEPRYKWTPP